jgi:exonuclease 1
MVVTIVFDGAPLPAKRVTEDERARSRKEAFEQACQLERDGKIAEANILYTKSVDVSPDMAFEVSEVLKETFPSDRVHVIVAPYEADAQLGYLSRSGLIDIVISEDSDLLVYGCSKVLYKLDFKSESGKLILSSDILSTPTFSRLSWDMFVFACLIAGCDYIGQSFLKGISLVKAVSIAAKLEGYLSSSRVEIMSPQFFNRLVILLSMELDVPDDLVGPITAAWQTFHHQTVFCPLKKQLVPLTPGNVDSEISGEMYSSEDAVRVANCIVHPDIRVEFVRIERQVTKKVRPNPPPRPPPPIPPPGPLIQLWYNREKSPVEVSPICISDSEELSPKRIESPQNFSLDLSSFEFENQPPPRSTLPDLSQFIFNGHN